MAEACADLDRFISNQQYSEAIMLGLQMLQQGYDYEILEDELCYALTTFTQQLVTMQRHANAEWLWQKSLDLCQGQSEIILHGYAKFKCTLNEILQGIDVLHSFQQNNPPPLSLSLPLLESLENMKALVADQWHYRMLNDMERNEVSLLKSCMK